MNISPNEAEESLAAIQNITQRTRRSIAGSGTYITLIVTGAVWLVGFLCTQFLSGNIVGYIWGGLSLLGTAVGVILGVRRGKRVRSPSFNEPAKRAIIFWLLLVLFALAFIVVARPSDGKQATMFVILFIMLGQMAMGMLLSFSFTWWAVPVAALALIGYFLLPAYFYLWTGLLGGGGMIALGLYIRLRW